MRRSRACTIACYWTTVGRRYHQQLPDRPVLGELGELQGLQGLQGLEGLEKLGVLGVAGSAHERAGLWDHPHLADRQSAEVEDLVDLVCLVLRLAYAIFRLWGSNRNYQAWPKLHPATPSSRPLSLVCRCQHW